ncbi:hypothetical protein EDB85DRAFT_1920725 [Lactarius pseudohatsudake]|nr:hypothetical protein EDB85DRAFT_1920725 [Lactarius pseudohatsudake]
MFEKVFLRLLLILFHGSIKDGLEIGRRGSRVRCPGYDTSTAGEKRPSGNTRSRIGRHEVTPALPRLVDNPI